MMIKHSICSVSGCLGKAHARGWCNKHLKRWQAHGTPTFENFLRAPLWDRLWDKTMRDGNTTCIWWTGSVNRDGYGTIRSGKSVFKAHRAAYEIAVGPVPNGMCVLHRCDNPGCVNPEHLFLGTQAENMADAVYKGRHKTPKVRGEAHANSKLTEEQVIAIRASQCSQKSIAKQFGITQSNVSQIKNGKRWKENVIS